MRKRNSGALRDAQKLYKLLLYEVSGGTLGQAPDSKLFENQNITFGDKNKVLDNIIKISEIERRNAADTEDMSGFDLIRSKINAGNTSGNGRNSRRSTEDSADEPESDTSDDDAETSEDGR